MAPIWTGGYMIDQLECPSCGKATPPYYDGAEYAAATWDKINKSEPQWAVYNEKDERVAIVGPAKKKEFMYA
jgi:uncharacterized protein CbrC (UPF0167 family)